MKKKPWIILTVVCIIMILMCGYYFLGNRISTDKVIGDWYGTAEVDSESVAAILSINPDGKWASCVGGDVNSGTWKIDSESPNRLVLTVEYKGINLTNTWYFEKLLGGKYCYNYVYGEEIPIEVTRMENESKEQLIGDWEGDATHIYEDGEECDFEASLSIEADNSWSSSVSGSENIGHWNYISEAGHLIVLTAEYNGGILTNTWAFTKDKVGQCYYEYVYGEDIRIPVEKVQ